MKEATSRRSFLQKTAWATTGIALLSSGIASAFTEENPFDGYNPYADAKTDLRTSLLGTYLEISGIILNSEKHPLQNITVEVWHLSPNSKKYRHRAKLTTDASGRYTFKTDQPNNLKGKAPRIYFKVSNGDTTYFTELITGEHACITSKHFEENNEALGSLLMPTTTKGIFGKKIDFNISI